MTPQAKSYYLPQTRAIAVGVILILVGLAFTFGFIDIHRSVWYNIQFILISFEGVVEFFMSIIMLIFKAGLIVGGYYYIKYSTGVERARLDDKGFYYRLIPKGSRYSKIMIDSGPLTFTPYSQIIDLTYKKNFWTGGQLYLTLPSGMLPLIALGVLKDSEKIEIAKQVKAQINTGR
ncbi:hypothetical protein IDJ75_00480 [Mucilaginibacter rigui]|uniref:PH domain-containing protein n=1 Tax=Mucilaginibacter rigui TaxID=534635 RepID=A0ABR7WZG4_9SPHI|nr:hypothetical protein [Mucilaginibacter rigui]MBD1383737.1 hypothetical protein [Mucilaginibacter rigui]